MSTGTLALIPAISRHRTAGVVKTPLSFTGCEAGASLSNALSHIQLNDEMGHGGGIFIQITATIINRTCTEDSTEVNSCEPFYTDDSDKMSFDFDDVHFTDSTALAGNALYVVTNLQSILERDVWKELIPSDSNAADFLYSIVNTTQPITDLSLVDNTSYTDTLPYPPTSKSSSSLSAGSIVGIVFAVIIFVIVIIVLLLVCCCCISSCPLYRSKSQQKEKEEEQEEGGGDDTSADAEEHQSIAAPTEETHSPSTSAASSPSPQATPTPTNQQTDPAPESDTVGAPPSDTSAPAEPTVEQTDTADHYEQPHDEEPAAQEMQPLPSDSHPEQPAEAQPDEEHLEEEHSEDVDPEMQDNPDSEEPPL